MDLKLIEHLRALKEADLFTGPTPEENASRKDAVKNSPRLKAELSVEDLRVIRELHEQNLTPNPRFKFTEELWVEILTLAETERPGTIEKLVDLELAIYGALITLDHATTGELRKKAGLD